MTDELTIATATLQDVPQLEALVNSAYRGESSKSGWTTEADLLDGIRTDTLALTELIQKPHAVLLKCTNSRHTLLGCVYLEKEGSQLYLGMLTVAPQAQAAGMGKKLLAAAEDHARGQGCRSIAMTVISVRHELIAWYERRGFQQTGAKKPFPNDPRFGIPKQPLEFVVMEKAL